MANGLPETERPVSEIDAERLSSILATRTAELRDLATMGAVITAIHDVEKVLSVVMDMSMGLVNGEVGMIMLEREGELVTKIAWGIRDDLVRKLQYKDGLDLPTYVFSSGQPVELNDLDIREEDGLRIDSILCLPIKTGLRALGVLLIINKADGSGFDTEDRERLEMLLNFVAVAIENSRLVQEQLRRQKIVQEMAIARQVQETILPQDIDMIEGAEIGAAYFPAREVGGDFYDVFKLSDDSFIVVMGDVSNKGVPAALVMSAAAGIIKSILTDSPEIPVNDLAGRLNVILSREIIRDREMFITLFFARFDLAHLEVTYCNAGHLPGLFWSEADNRIFELPEGGPIVGQFPEMKFTMGRRTLLPGDRLFLFTDGLTEAEDASGHLFGRERAEQVFTSEIELPPKEFCRSVKEWVDRFTAGAPEDSRDDFTILQVLVR